MNRWVTTVTLILLPFQPPLLLFILNQMRAGRNLSSVAFASSCVYFCTGIAVMGWGIWRRKRGCAISGGGLALVALVAPSIFAATSIAWIGVQQLSVVVVVTGDDGSPVSNAAVRVFGDGETTPATVRTNPQGVAKLSPTFTAVGMSSFVRQTGSLYLWRAKIQVEAPGYLPLDASLDKFTGSGWDLYGPPLPPVNVTLHR